jgi:predicted ATP-grasp superfamily ATP-dependent carboligase
MTSRYEGPSGIVGVLLEACREAGLPTISLWAATPHYLAANPNPKAMRALLTQAASIIDLGVDTDELDAVVSEFESKVETAMEASDDFTDYVRKLEESEAGGNGALSLHNSDQLIEDIEEFLKHQG